MKTFIDRLRDNLALAEREGDLRGAARLRSTIATLTETQEACPHILRARKLFVPQKETGQ
jgi:hypothetical protein